MEPCWLFNVCPVSCTFCAEISPLLLLSALIFSCASPLTEPMTPSVLLVCSEPSVRVSVARICPLLLSICVEVKFNALALCKRPSLLLSCCAFKSKLSVASIKPFWLSAFCAVILITLAVSLPAWLSKV